MDKNLVYHGSNVPVSHPQIMINGYYKDFGYGFYCTKIIKQAKRWAISRRGKSIVSTYSFLLDPAERTLFFEKMTDEWLDFIVDCRRGMEHRFDVIEGPMADDQIWNYVEDFIDGKISRSAFWELARFKYPTHQIAFCTDISLKMLHYEGSESL